MAIDNNQFENSYKEEYYSVNKYFKLIFRVNYVIYTWRTVSVTTYTSWLKALQGNSSYIYVLEGHLTKW